MPHHTMNNTDKKTLLIVWHSRTDAAHQMAQAARRGAQEVATTFQAAEQLRIIMKRACDANIDDLLSADGYVFSAPENLAALSGEMKEFFDRHYYLALDKIGGRPYALLISAGSDGTMAVKQAERICTGWRLSPATPALIVNTQAQTPEAIQARKQITAENTRDCHEKGGTVAALLLL